MTKSAQATQVLSETPRTPATKSEGFSGAVTLELNGALHRFDVRYSVEGVSQFPGLVAEAAAALMEMATVEYVGRNPSAPALYVADRSRNATDAFNRAIEALVYFRELKA
jgi:hypothetical protein